MTPVPRSVGRLVPLCCLLLLVGPGFAQGQTPQAAEEPKAPSCE